MNQIKLTEIQKKRRIAIEQLLELSEGWDKVFYSSSDFIIDRLLRKQKKIPDKELGKEPFEYIEL